ncbi:MAG: tripartite tricarboxylate transporter substrate binding protein [Burkholderiales bacterium]|nr:tripartite tricarboxylate transporter substrate binding protein [Burkholderiales bacterium]
MLALAASSSIALAADYPARPIRMVVAVAPGGPTDIYARLVGQRLTERWGQAVVIDNRAGAGQTIGADIVARAVPDGHTLLMATQTFAVNPSIFKQLPYDSLADFAPVSLVVRQPLALFVPQSLPARNVRELVDYARANAGKLNFGSSGPSSSLRFAGELLNALAAIKLTHVPYKGTAPALTALAGNQVQVVFSGLPAAHPFYSSGRVRALAVAAERRLEAMPDLPTTAEAGLPGLTAESWFGVLAPGRTPAAVVAKLAGEIASFVRSPEIRKRIATEGAEAIGNTPAEFSVLIKTEMQKWAKVVRDNQIRID